MLTADLSPVVSEDPQAPPQPVVRKHLFQKAAVDESDDLLEFGFRDLGVKRKPTEGLLIAMPAVSDSITWLKARRD